MLTYAGTCANIASPGHRREEPLTREAVLGILSRKTHLGTGREHINTIQLFGTVLHAEAVWLDEVFAARPEITLNLLGDARKQGSLYALSFLRSMPHVQRLSLRDMDAAEDIEALSTLPGLYWLSTDLAKTKDYGFLGGLPGLRVLQLRMPAAAWPDYDQLAALPGLTHLGIGGCKRDVSQLGRLQGLEQLILTGLTLEDYSFVQALPALQRLGVRWGASHDFSALAACAQIQVLEMWRISGLANIDFTARMQGLRFLYLHELRNLTALPDYSATPHLESLMLDQMRGLRDYTGLRHAPTLRQFRGWCPGKLEPQDFLPVLQNPGLQGFSYGGGSQKQGAALDALVAHHLPNNQALAWQKYAVDFYDTGRIEEKPL